MADSLRLQPDFETGRGPQETGYEDSGLESFDAQPVNECSSDVTPNLDPECVYTEIDEEEGLKDLCFNLESIARLGGSPLLIDTVAEKDFALQELTCTQQNAQIQLLEDNAYKAWFVDLLEGTRQSIEDHPNLNWSVLLGQNFLWQDVCEEGQSEDCIQLLIPIPADCVVSLPVYSGASGSKHIDYLSLTQPEWDQVTAPLQDTTITSAAEEREALRQAIALYRSSTMPDDYRAEGFLAYLTNFTWGQDQQDCCDVSQTMAHFIMQLSAAGLLKYHSFDFFNPTQTNYFFAMHMLNPLTETKSGQTVYVDAWHSTVQVYLQSPREVRVAQDEYVTYVNLMATCGFGE